MNPKILIIDSSSFEIEKLKINLGTIGKFTYTQIVKEEDYFLIQKELVDFSLILIDIEFPNIETGFKILEAMNHNPKLAFTPKIIITKLDSGPLKSRASVDYGVIDYILKPYTHDRLSKSINLVLPYDSRFFYSFENTNIISMPIEDLIVQQISLSRRANTKLSIIFMTPKSIKLSTALKEGDFDEFQQKVYETVVKYIKMIVRKTDMVMIVNKTDIFVILNLADLFGAKKAMQKLIESMNEGLKLLNDSVENLFYISSSTFPDEGADLETLILNALKKINEQSALDKIVTVSKEKFNSVKTAYQKYQ